MTSPSPRAVQVVDAHHHLWDLRTHRYQWQGTGLTSEARARTTYTIENYLEDMRGLGVRGSVHVQGQISGDPVEETAWLQGLADQWGLPNAIVGFCDLASPDCAEVLDRHMQFPNFRGVRQVLNWSPDPRLSEAPVGDYISDSSWLAGFRELARRGLSFDLQAHPWQLVQAAVLASSFPDVHIVVDHLGMPIYRAPAGRESWAAAIGRLALRPNVSIKLSGFALHDAEWSADSVRREVEFVLDHFTTRRCMFATNAPVDSFWSSAAYAIGQVQTLLADLSDGERSDVFMNTARRIYRIDLRESETAGERPR